MGETTKIEWADATINFWWGCTKVSPACQYCYAEAMDARFHPRTVAKKDASGITVASHWGIDSPRMLRLEQAAKEAFRLEHKARLLGTRIRVFTNSMADFFEDHADLVGARLWALEVIQQTPHLDWMILTKRPENVMPSLREIWNNQPLSKGALPMIFDWIAGMPPANIWLGTTAENQEWADKRIPELLKVPAKIHFLSCEPLLGPLDLTFLWVSLNQTTGMLEIDWVICGGESGLKARPMNHEWAHSLNDQCQEARVPFFFKQWGEWAPGKASIQKPDHDPLVFEVPMMLRIGKAAAGRELDGRTWDELPEVR